MCGDVYADDVEAADEPGGSGLRLPGLLLTQLFHQAAVPGIYKLAQERRQRNRDGTN